jgi:hypothetical protein
MVLIRNPVKCCYESRYHALSIEECVGENMNTSAQKRKMVVENCWHLKFTKMWCSHETNTFHSSIFHSWKNSKIITSVLNFQTLLWIHHPLLLARKFWKQFFFTTSHKYSLSEIPVPFLIDSSEFQFFVIQYFIISYDCCQWHSVAWDVIVYKHHCCNWHVQHNTW